MYAVIYRSIHGNSYKREFKTLKEAEAFKAKLLNSALIQAAMIQK